MENFIMAFFLIFVTFSFAQSEKPVYKVEVKCELTIGGDTDDINQQFSLPRSVAVDDEGSIFIIDGRLKEIRKFNKKGEFQKSFGKSGNGPGEINYQTIRTPPLSFYNNQLFALQGAKGFYYIFNTDGKYINSMKTEKTIFDYLICKNGNFLTNHFANPINNPKWKPQEVDLRNASNLFRAITNSYFICLSNSNGQPQMLLDSLNTIGTRYLVINGALNMLSSTPFDPRIFYQTLPNGNIVIANSASNKLKLFNDKGELIRTVDCKTEPRVIKEKDLEKFFEKSKITVEKYQNEIKKTFPTNYPFFNNMFVDSDGNIYLRTPHKNGENFKFDIYSQDGKYLDRIEMSPEIASNAYCVKNGYLYQIVNDGENFASIKKIKIKLIKI